MHDESQIPIWFFIGGLLLIYGLLIAASGLYNLLSPPPPEQQVALFRLHADLWWGLFMTVVGTIYVVWFRPKRAVQ
jgi:hypothetical protein